ncbi:hypothetical protein [Niabella ginsengisoli]|uniref:Carboxypeptidase regulatory-like domain-containing protein n=1 Tax=Niabella ginsengisoli TaxID=522298 RepID=A0ABS9SFV0_9BACT|nr:hypothetical protein [Niabella ginsengisoli]MCH5597224.1 hypothetical protein [Niabella ginsengisoli]
MKENKWSCCLLLLCATFFLIIPLTSLAQQSTAVTGVVVDETAKPVVGASVQFQIFQNLSNRVLQKRRIQ